jgi:large subunit ribosomal protein L21
MFNIQYSEAGDRRTRNVSSMRVTDRISFTGQALTVYTTPFAQVLNMYAIVQAGGRQHRVSPGGFAEIDGTAPERGTELTLGQVLLVERDGGEIVAGAPFVADARVLAVVEGETRGPKIRVFKKKRRKGMRRTKGHRAFFTRVRITDILLGQAEQAERAEEGSSEASTTPAPSPQ